MHERWFSKTRWLSILLVFLMGIGITGCGDRANFPSFSSSRPAAQSQPAKIKEVAPPDLIRDLRRDLESYQPQVQILSPRPDEVLQTQSATVRFSVQDLPLFKDEDLGMGPHLHVFVDDQPYQAVYDATAPLVLEGLTPGTHTIRAFASRPWHESFKNEGAFAQTTFHVFAKTAEKAPSSEAPLLTYSRPQGTYGAEPIMLDFYLTQAPLHTIAQADEEDDILDWTIRCTINGESFEVDEWRPIYLKGFKPGQNWVQLELLDETGAAIANVFNDTVRIIDYAPNGNDTLSQITRSELPFDNARRIVIAGYEPPAPKPEVIPVVEEPALEDVPVEEPTEAIEESGLDVEEAPLPASDVEPAASEPVNAQEQGEEASSEDLPVEILAPEVETETESALEQQMEEIQEQVAPMESDTASGEMQPESPLAEDAAQGEAEEMPILSETDLAGATLSDAEPSPEISELSTSAFEQPNVPSAELSEEEGAADESLAFSRAPAVSKSVDSQANMEAEVPALSKSLPAERPDSAPQKIAPVEVKPSPVLNSYEARAILEELDDLESKVENLKGTIASATDQPAPRDAVSPQIEDLRSQLDQLKDKFGDTWQRLSDFVRLKLQG